MILDLLLWFIGGAVLLVGIAWSWFNMFIKGVLATEDYELSQALSEGDEESIPRLTMDARRARSAHLRLARNMRTSSILVVFGAAILVYQLYVLIFQ